MQLDLSSFSRALPALLLTCALPAAMAGERLTGTWGVTSAEGAAGGGLVPWALMAGSGSRDQAGASAAATAWHSQGGFQLRTLGVAAGWHDTFELSLAHWQFGLSDTVPGQSLRMDVAGLKWRVWGDAVHDQDAWWPQVAVGLQHKRVGNFALPSALGARHAEDTEPYIAATKLWLAGLGGRNLLANVTLRGTRANQFGLLGFGGDRGDGRALKAEGSLAVLLRDDLALGAEWRGRPNRLSAFREQAAQDVFLAWFASRHASLTLAWLHLGQVADKPNQEGAYLSAQLAF